MEWATFSFFAVVFINLIPLNTFDIPIIGNALKGVIISYQTGVTVRKRQVWAKIGDFLPRVTLKFNGWPWKTIGHLSYRTPHQALCIIPSPYVNSNMSYGPETAKLRVDPCDLDPWPLILIFCMDICPLLSMVITPENFMMIRWEEHCEKGVTNRQTDGQTDGRTDGRTKISVLRAAWSQLTTSLIPFFVTISHIYWQRCVHEILRKWWPKSVDNYARFPLMMLTHDLIL